MFGESSIVPDSVFTPELNDSGQVDVVESTNQEDVSPEDGQDTLQVEDELLEQEEVVGDGGELPEEPAGEEPLADESSQGEVEPEAEVMYAGKFKSVEDMESAYLNLQPAYTKQSQELSAIRKASLVVEAPEEPGQVNTPAYEPDQSSLGVQYPGVMEKLIGEVTAEVNQSVVAPLKAQLAIQEDRNKELAMSNTIAQLATKYDDFKDVSPLLKEVLNNDPDLWKLGETKALEHAYLE